MAALQYKIPEIYQPGFERLVGLSDNNFSKVRTLLSETSVSENEDAVAAKLSESLELPPEETKKFASTLFSMFYLLFGSNSTIGEIAAGLAIAYSSSHQLEGQETEKLRLRIEAILSGKSNLYYTVKSRILYGESYTVFEDCKIITDIRLTFDNQSIDQGYKGGFILHNLKFNFRENGESMNFVMNCLSSDLEKVKTVIDRALEKEKLIRESNLGKEISFIEIKPA